MAYRSHVSTRVFSSDHHACGTRTGYRTRSPNSSSDGECVHGKRTQAPLLYEDEWDEWDERIEWMNGLPPQYCNRGNCRRIILQVDGLVYGSDRGQGDAVAPVATVVSNEAVRLS